MSKDELIAGADNISKQLIYELNNTNTSLL